ncbi:MAG: HNH endonuclease [Betaproteobacteria bacterium]|nr:HNH endonuclease [Betaproteobacteria bacterium]
MNRDEFGIGVERNKRPLITKRLGNMVLLRASENVELGNSGFSKKKREYAKSSILITKQSAEYSAWTLVQINDRQNKMAKVAVRTWPIDIKS